MSVDEQAPPPTNRLIVGVLIGVVVGAVLAVLATGAFGGDDDDEPDTRPIELPDRLGDLAATSVAERDGELLPVELRERLERRDTRGVRVVSDAYGGAAAAVRTYWDAGLETQVLAIAVRAASPEPFVTDMFNAPADLGLEVSPFDVRYVDDIACIVVNPITAEGDEVDVSRVVIRQCQRSGDGLTVIVQPNGPSDIADAAAIVDDAWDAIGETG